ncbi:MAG: hypothetical protein N3A71_03200 [Candidatus Dojkabacteria bacterium]|nr:hypothetical protein [Candidatus Dojkabacteria bacterium]
MQLNNLVNAKRIGERLGGYDNIRGVEDLQKKVLAMHVNGDANKIDPWVESTYSTYLQYRNEVQGNSNRNESRGNAVMSRRRFLRAASGFLVPRV